VGGWSSSEADLARGGAQASSVADLARGGAQPSGEVRLVALVGHGGHQGRDRVVCGFWAHGLVCVLHFLRDEVGFPRLFRGPLWLSPTVAPEHLRGIRWDPADAGAG
jgi:hypothetical protein